MSIRADLVIDQGVDFTVDLNLVDINSDVVSLYGYTVVSQMKKWYTSSNVIILGSSINATAGMVILNLPAAQTSLLYPGRYVYDVNITSSTNVVSRVVEGIVTVTPGVSNINLYMSNTSGNGFFSNTAG